MKPWQQLVENWLFTIKRFLVSKFGSLLRTKWWIITGCVSFFIRTRLHVWLSCTSQFMNQLKQEELVHVEEQRIRSSVLGVDGWLLLIRRIDLYIHVCLDSWDESSSISSGLSDGSDNLSSEEFNTSPVLNSLPSTPIGSRRNSGVVVSNFQPISCTQRCTLVLTAAWSPAAASVWQGSEPENSENGNEELETIWRNQNRNPIYFFATQPLN